MQRLIVARCVITQIFVDRFCNLFRGGEIIAQFVCKKLFPCKNRTKRRFLAVLFLPFVIKLCEITIGTARVRFPHLCVGGFFCVDGFAYAGENSILTFNGT
jgi:hypothetical protein